MAVNKKSRDLLSFAALLLAIGVVIFANILADRAFARWDLTAEGRYSLSEPFRRVLARLEAPAKLTYYVSGAVPSWFEQTKRDILDKLGEIKTISKGNIELEIVDPTEDKEARKKLEEEGLDFKVPDRTKDKLSYSVLFTSLRLTYQEKPSVLIQVIQSPEDIEYELASRVMELTTEKKPVIALHAPKADQAMMNPMMQRKPPQSGFEWILKNEQDAKKFDVKDVEFTESSSIPADAKLLILIRPKELSERARYEIIKYLCEGGRVFFLASPFKINQEFGFRAEKTPSGLEDYLRDAGVTWTEGFVCDESNVRLITSVNPFTQQVQYGALPFFVQVLPENVDQESPITRLLPGLVLPFPSALTINEETAKSAGLHPMILARTSKQSWTEPFQEMFDPKKVNKKPTYEAPKTVFASLEGQFPFPWEGKNVPAWGAKKEDEEKKDEKKDEKKEEKKEIGAPASVTKKPGLLMLWACPESFHSMYLSDQQLGEVFRGNVAVLPNVVEAAALGEDLIKLRSKKYATRAIQKYDGADNDLLRNLIKLSLIAAVPLLLVLFAFGRWMLRRGTQLGYERKFAATSGPSSFTP